MMSFKAIIIITMVKKNGNKNNTVGKYFKNNYDNKLEVYLNVQNKNNKRKT